MHDGSAVRILFLELIIRSPPFARFFNFFKKHIIDCDTHPMAQGIRAPMIGSDWTPWAESRAPDARTCETYERDHM